MEELKFLEEQQVASELIKRVEEFRSQYEVVPETAGRIVKPSIPFYGKDILEMAIAGLLKGENLLLTGPKATGKNILAENLAYIFNRPAYNVSFHVNTNSGDLIGTDTFVDNEVKLRKGTIYQCAEYGGFGILDEINMAKNDAVSVLHATLDYRRSIDVPGYDKIDLHPAARFIGTMNYGYAGTKELNEALVSRFLVIDMPAQTEESLEFIFRRMFPNIKENARTQFIGVFLDLQLKATNSEISTKPLDLRGLLAAMKIVETGLSPRKAVTMGVVNKTFDTPGILAKAGCQVSIITDAPVIPQQYLPLCAGLAVKAGMDPFQALQAITLNPARHLGVADRVGSLEVGKDADIAIFEGNPLRDIQCKTKAVFVNGQQVSKG